MGADFTTISEYRLQQAVPVGSKYFKHSI